MKKGILLILSLIMILTFSAVPAMAEDVSIDVNSDQLKAKDSYITDGITMIGLDDYLSFAGADVVWNSDSFTITEDGKSLSMSVNQLAARLNDSEIKAPLAPVRVAEQVMLPLRFVAESFGYSVSWDGQQSQVTLSRQESRDNMSPQELLAKSSAETQKINTYSMQGALDMNIKLDGGGEEMPGGAQKIKSQFYGQMQNDPMKAYTKQTLQPEASIPGLDGTTIETYMTGSKIYMKMPGLDQWTVMDMPFPADFIKQQQDIQSNPLKAVEQMKEIGMLCNFGNDVTRDGQEYYVVNAALDMEKFMEGYQKIIGDVVKSLPADLNKGQDVQGVMQELLKNMKLDYYCTTYINKKTLMSDFISFDMKLDFTIDPSMFGIKDEKTGNAVISMQEDITGEFKITGTDKPFVEPDVSAAIPADQLMAPETAKTPEATETPEVKE